MVFLYDYESLRLLNTHIDSFDQPITAKLTAKYELSIIFCQIMFALCTSSVGSIVKSSTHVTVSPGIASPIFNSLAFLILVSNGATKSFKTFCFYGGLKKISSPYHLLTYFKFNLLFLKDFGVNLSVSILSPIDIARLCFMQRRES